MKKKILVLLTAILSMTIVSCTDDSDNSNSSNGLNNLVLSSPYISVKVGESYNINVENAEYITLENSYIAGYEKLNETSYNVIGKKVGKTKFNFGNGTCDINVTGNYNYFTDPSLLWGQAKNKIKEVEDRELVIDDPDYLLYFEKYSPELDYVFYTFYNYKLYAVLLLIPLDKQEELHNWMGERFYPSSESNQDYYIYESPYFGQDNYVVLVNKVSVEYNNKNYCQVQLINPTYAPIEKKNEIGKYLHIR